jgi:hypothetical protein
LKLAAALDGDQGADRLAAMLGPEGGTVGKVKEHKQYDSFNQNNTRAIPHVPLPVSIDGRYGLFSTALFLF